MSWLAVVGIGVACFVGVLALELIYDAHDGDDW